MAKRPEICGLHCPGWTRWLFLIVILWFVLGAFGIPTFGGFWSWMVLLIGLCGIVCLSNPKHQKTSCFFKGTPLWLMWITLLVGIWFVLGDAGALSVFGLNLLYIVALLAAIWALTFRR